MLVHMKRLAGNSTRAFPQPVSAVVALLCPPPPLALHFLQKPWLRPSRRCRQATPLQPFRSAAAQGAPSWRLGPSSASHLPSTCACCFRAPVPSTTCSTTTRRPGSPRKRQRMGSSSATLEVQVSKTCKLTCKPWLASELVRRGLFCRVPRSTQRPPEWESIPHLRPRRSGRPPARRPRRRRPRMPRSLGACGRRPQATAWTLIAGKPRGDAATLEIFYA